MNSLYAQYTVQIEYIDYNCRDLLNTQGALKASVEYEFPDFFILHNCHLNF